MPPERLTVPPTSGREDYLGARGALAERAVANPHRIVVADAGPHPGDQNIRRAVSRFGGAANARIARAQRQHDHKTIETSSLIKALTGHWGG
jgi:hypothetical protein